MKRQLTGTFHVHDSNINATTEGDEYPFMGAYWCMRGVVEALRNRGWLIGRDPEIERGFEVLGPRRRYGRRGDLELKIDASGRCVEVAFFQNVANVENPHGGYYDFNKLGRMPYLLRLRTALELSKIADQLTRRGLVVVAEGKLRNLAAHQLFTYDPSKHTLGRDCSGRALACVTRRLRSAVQAEQFERAARLRDVRDRLTSEAA